MKWLADMRRPERTRDVLRDQPVTVMLTLAFSSVCAFGLIYIFAFSDTAEQRWQHFYGVFAMAAFVGTCLAFAKAREDRVPLAIRARRAVWLFVLLCYACAIGGVLWLCASPFIRPSDRLRLACYLGSASPMAFVAWKLFQTREKANPTSQLKSPPRRG